MKKIYQNSFGIDKQRATTLFNMQGGQLTINAALYDEKSSESSGKSISQKIEFPLYPFFTKAENIRTSQFFTGRVKFMEDMYRALQNHDASILLCGPEGMGKTEVCRQILSFYKKRIQSGQPTDYDCLGYVSYHDSLDETLEDGLSIKFPAAVSAKNVSPWEDLYTLPYNYRVLFIVDDLPEYIDVDYFKERFSKYQGSLLCVCSKELPLGLKVQRLPQLSYQKCIDLFAKISNMGIQGEEAVWDQLLEMGGYKPGAVTQLAEWCISGYSLTDIYNSIIKSEEPEEPDNIFKTAYEIGYNIGEFLNSLFSDD